ncbi:contactin-like isoform X2 [Biomphalaria glabrata]|uniref:Contactin-like isoform X2 n=1 Tax=Biomphalaria glabrata TaxID=6526 RepID=A0A9W2YCG4_BIOGL|nr:contactin-like isoform X2 [Biomphalaria glabrata]
MLNRAHFAVLTVISIVQFGNPQVFECPSSWYTYGSSCYQFYGDFPRNYAEAMVHCSEFGAGLVSVESKPEHDFISKWIQVNDKYLRDWMTSGIREASRKGSNFVWKGTGDDVTGTDVFWEDGRDFNNSVGIIVYRYFDSGYRWSVGQSSDQLPYMCEVPQTEAYRIVHDYRDFDYGLEKYDANSLERGPHFILQPHSTVIVGKPPEVILECVTSGNPQPTYTWWKGEQFETEVTSALDKRYTITNGKLIIANPTDVLDSGNYRCIAENKYGSVISQGVLLSFGSIGEFSNVPDAPVNVKAFEGAAVDCSKLYFKPAVKYNWYKKDAQQFVRPEYQAYMFISQNGKLYFSEVTRADEGSYFCIAVLTGINQYTIGTDQPPARTSLPIPLVVHDQTPKANWGPVIQNEFIAVFPKPPLVDLDIRMECFAYGTSITEFKYYWRRENGTLPKLSYLMDHNRVLIIPSATLEDQGIYTCTVTRSSSARDEKSVDLKLGAKPFFIKPLRDQHADIGSPLTWRCDARASPAAIYQWYRNGELVQTNDETFIKVNYNVLLITKLDPKLHNGMYQCAASNIYGTSMSEGQLRVLAFAPHFQKFPMMSETRASLQGNLTLHCRPEAAPFPVITWFKNGVELSTSLSNIVQSYNGRLTILNVNAADHGTYTCRAVNQFGQAEDKTKVTTIEGTAITTAPQDQMALFNSTTFFYCQASVAKNTDMVFIWHFNGRPIDFYRDPEYRQVPGDQPGKSGLYIQQVNFAHTGMYECQASTTMNSDKRGGFLTVVGPPAEPAGVQADSTTVTNSTVLVRWTENLDNGHPITHYIVEAATYYERDQWTVVIGNLPAVLTIHTTHEKRYVLVSGLLPGCGYRFRVTAVNQIGHSPPSIPSGYVQTLSAPPSLAPLCIGGGDGKVGDLIMTWKPLTPEQQGGPGIGYRLYWRRHGISEEEQWSTADVGDVGRYVTIVGAENYFLEYDFKIQAFNNAGLGPNSTVNVIMSSEDMPIAVPTNVMAEGYNGTAMEVMWTPVPQVREIARGKILGYQINWWHYTEQAMDYREFIRHYGQRDSGFVIGLISDNFYYFTIQVYNSAGLGPISEYYFQESLHAPAAGYPEEIRVYSAGKHNGHHAVEVWWRGIHITQPEGNIHGFVIFYWHANEDYRSACRHVIHDHHAHHAHIEVEPGVVYAIRVAAWGEGGYGHKSLTTYFTIEGNNILVDSKLASTVEAFRSTASVLNYPLSLVYIATATTVYLYILSVMNWSTL